MGARPGRILEVIDVDLARPRTDARASKRFGEIRTYAWELLKQGIAEAAMREERG